MGVGSIPPGKGNVDSIFRGIASPIFRLLFLEQSTETAETWGLLVKLHETSFGEERFLIVLLFSRGSPLVHECSANFRSLLSIFDGFRQKYHKSQISRSKFRFFFCYFEYISTFLVQNSVRRETCNFRTIMVDFHEYTLNMTSYHVTLAIDCYF